MKTTAAIFGGVFGLTLLCLTLPGIVMAADSGVQIPVGQVVTDWKPYVVTLFGGLITWGFRRLPENVVAVLANFRVEQLLMNAVNYGYNAVEGATKDKVITAELGSQVADAALDYFVKNSGKWLRDWSGGPEGFTQKVWSRLNLDPAADASAVRLVASTLKASGKKD